MPRFGSADQAAGQPTPRRTLGLRIRLLAALAKRFGVRLVLPAITSMEQGAVSEYDDQPEAVAAHMPQEERTHARVFEAMNEAPSG